MEDKERESACRYFMACISGIGAVTAGRLMEYYGSACRVWELTGEEILRDRIMTERQKAALKKSQKQMGSGTGMEGYRKKEY